ncbi:expressed unknown protein [Seminavis robusta]|uniref:Uncharacterized protein n=1 Tax=Seminavis robusta TaxID=568900 RepID=A0A9N8D719_9STRA|nr:expressed unknown protein [Seminavis robusta]|eukprot:Sro21_g014740.1 n/a (321) ;mRNA; r:89143-90105
MMSSTTGSNSTSTNLVQRRTSSRQRMGGNSNIYWSEINFPSVPWDRHVNDIEHGRLAKCTKRILGATEDEIAKLPISYLAKAISKVAVTSKPKEQQERLLMDYARALLARNVDLSDCALFWRPRSALSVAAYYGYPKLLKLLLDANCFASYSELLSTVENGQHECLTILLEQRKEHLQMVLHEQEFSEEMKTLELAIHRKDLVIIQILRDLGQARISDRAYDHAAAKLPANLQKLYPTNQNVLAWSKQLHWSFPTSDRQMINYIWYLIAPNSGIAAEVWLNIFSFMGRGWWVDVLISAKRKEWGADVTEMNIIPSGAGND